MSVADPVCPVCGCPQMKPATECFDKFHYPPDLLQLVKENDDEDA